MNKFKNTLIFSSLLLFGCTTATLVGCGSENKPVVNTYKINVTHNEGITVKLSNSKPRFGETVTVTLTYDETKLEIKSITETSGIIVNLTNNSFKFIMPDHDVNFVIESENIIPRDPLKTKLQEVIDARNYLVSSVVSNEVETADVLVYYTENANMTQILKDDEVIKVGEINGETGVYTYFINNNKVIPSKILFNSYKNEYNSFWDKKHNHGGLHLLNIQYIDENVDEYTFKPAEMANFINIFYNTQIDYSKVMAVNPVVKTYVNKHNELEFDINMGRYGHITETVKLVNDVDMEKDMPEVFDFLGKGGKELPSESTNEQKELVRKAALNNYVEVLPDIKDDSGKYIKTAKIHYTPNYYYTEYSKEYKDYSASHGEPIVDEGHVQIGEDIFKFTIEPEGGKDVVKVNEASKKANVNIVEEIGYFGTTSYLGLIQHSSTVVYNAVGGQIIFDEIEDKEVAADFGSKVFHLDSSNPNDIINLDSAYSCGVYINGNDVLTFYSMNSGGGLSFFSGLYNDFGQAEVQIMEEFIASK